MEDGGWRMEEANDWLDMKKKQNRFTESNLTKETHLRNVEISDRAPKGADIRGQGDIVY
jgi:hypothetical protein